MPKTRKTVKRRSTGVRKEGVGRTEERVVHAENQSVAKPVVEGRQELYDSTFNEFVCHAKAYGLESGVPDHVDSRLVLVLSCPESEIVRVLQKAKSIMEVHILAQWARGRASGPPSFRNDEIKAKRAESLAKMFERKGQVELAQKHRVRAELIRQRRDENGRV